MDVDGAVGDDDASPDSVHELLAGEDISTILQQEDEQVELSTCEVDGLAIDADGLAVEADLETAEGEKTLAEAGFDYVHHIVAETFAVGDDVGVKRAYGVGVGTISCEASMLRSSRRPLTMTIICVRASFTSCIISCSREYCWVLKSLRPSRKCWMVRAVL